jgi:hypothetical protein
MNKTLITLGVGIWGVMLFLVFVLGSTLGILDKVFSSELFALTAIEIFAFAITIIGILKRD